MIDIVFDKDGKPLSPEECEEYDNDIWDCGIPMGKEDARRLWEKWGERLGMKEIFPELASKEKEVVIPAPQDLINLGLVEEFVENEEVKYKLTSLGRSVGKWMESMFPTKD